MNKEIINFDNGENEVVSLVKTGGYNYWNWKFPFIHFREEEVLIATKKKIFKMDK